MGFAASIAFSAASPIVSSPGVLPASTSSASVARSTTGATEPEGRSDGARELDPRQLARHDGLVALQEQLAQLLVVTFVHEVGPHDRTRVGVENAHRSARSEASASLAAVPSPAVDAIADDLDRCAAEAGTTR